MLEDNCQVLLDPLRVEVLGSTCLQLEGVLLKVLKPDPEEHSVCGVNRFNAVLKILLPINWRQAKIGTYLESGVNDDMEGFAD